MEREEEMGGGGGKDKNRQERNGQLRGIKRRYIFDVKAKYRKTKNEENQKKITEH